MPTNDEQKKAAEAEKLRIEAEEAAKIEKLAQTPKSEQDVQKELADAAAGRIAPAKPIDTKNDSLYAATYVLVRDVTHDGQVHLAGEELDGKLEWVRRALVPYGADLVMPKALYDKTRDLEADHKKLTEQVAELQRKLAAASARG